MKITELLRTTNLRKLIAALSTIAVIAIFITVYGLYRLSLEQQGRLLTESVNNQVELMRTMQQLGSDSGRSLIFNAIRNMQTINRQAAETGGSSEYVVAQRRGDKINFLLMERVTDHHHNLADEGLTDHGNGLVSIDINSSLAAPMRRALSGESGTMIGPDHHGDKVLAAYQYLPEYQLGIVAKIDLEELYAPYLVIILLTSAIAIIFVFAGAYAFAISVKPLYIKREQASERLRKQHQIMSRLVEKKDIDPCDMPVIFEEITEAACEGLSVSRVSIWLYNTDHSSLLCADLYNKASDEHDIIENSADVAAYPAYFKALESGPIAVNDNAFNDPRTRKFIEDLLPGSDTRALLDQPILIEGEDFGHFICEQEGASREWTIADQNFSHAIAERIAIAVTNCQHNKAQQSLKESEHRYELAVTGSNDGLWDWDMSSNRVYRSPQYKKLLGYDKNEFCSMHDEWQEHLHPEDRQHVTEVLKAHLENADNPYDVEYRLRTKSGHYRWFHSRGKALRDETGKAYRLSGSITDITDFKQIQSNLSRFKQTLGEISESIFMFDPETLKFFYVNKSAIDNTGYTEHQLMQMTLMDIQPEFNEKTLREMLSVLVSHPDESLTFEALQQNKNGEQSPIETHLQYIAPSKTTSRFVAIVRDISERTNAEIENYIQRTMLEHIFKAQDDFILGENREKVYEQLLNGILDITESEFGFIGEIIFNDDEPPFLRTRYITDIAWNSEMKQLYEKQTPSGFEFRNLDTLFGSVISTGDTVVANNPANDPRSGGLPKEHPPLNSFMGIPLKLGKNLMGMVGIANREAGYSEEIITKIQPLLSTCVNLIEAERTELLRNSMENALRTSEEQANTVLATVADGIITIDENGLVDSFNHAAEKIFGYSADEVIGNNINMLMPEPYHSAHDDYLKRYHQTGQSHILGASREVDAKRKNGTVFPIELSVSEMRAGNKHRYTGVVRDISERKQAEIALIAAKDEAEQANRTKSEFLSSMSHELRTPLNAIMGFAQLLQFDELLSSSQKKHAREIYNAGNLLLDLINDVLDLAKIEAGHIDLSIDSVSLEHVLDECFRLIRAQAEKNGTKLSYETSPAKISSCSDVWVRADNTRFKQILLNILSNAVKYNKKYGEVYVSSPPAPDGYRRICITDSGRGIARQDINNLFQPFNRLGAERGEIEGTGIGLVITRKLVELMGGSISVESEFGKGTSFMIDLPAAEAIVPVRSAGDWQPEKPSAGKHDKKRILVAEDNQTNQELITLQLETLGYKSDLVANGKEAVEMLNKHDYDLLLTDIHMPEVDGYQLTHAIRHSRESRIKNITIIAITANAATDEATRCIERGMNDYLSKPVDINQLQEKLNQWLPDTDRKTGNASSPRKIHNTRTTSNKAGIGATSAIDTDMLTRYVGSDPGKQKHFLTLFLETAPVAILTIHEAHNKHSCNVIKDTCHKLKSSARAVGATRLATLCQNIENAAINEDWNLIDKAVLDINSEMSEVESHILARLKDKEQQHSTFDFNDVLIVDDDQFVRDLVTSRLNNVGIDNVMTASSGEEALSFIRNTDTTPSVLLLDLNMPGMDGVEFLRHLSELHYQGNIILISGEDTRLLLSAENIARDRNLNILGALEKPLTIPSLTELLSQVGTENTVHTRHKKISPTENDLRQSIKNDELVVYYQPQIDITSKQLTGVEALVRWKHPELGMIPPDTFIPVAEELNLINEMTDIIMSKAMTQCAHWHEQGLSINLSINLSVDSLDRLDLPEHIVALAHKHQLDVSKIMLEVTESRLMQDITSALDILTRLSLKGMRLSIDDFGTGYSSMEQLQRVPFTELKVNRTFVNGAVHDRAARAILESSIDLAQKLNMTIVAEGVENDEDLALVAGLGCTYAQGYFIARPMPGDKLIAWHDNWIGKN